MFYVSFLFFDQSLNQFSFGRIADQLIPIEFFAESAVHARARTKQIAILNPSKRSYFCQKNNPSALFFREKSGRSLPLSFKSLLVRSFFSEKNQTICYLYGNRATKDRITKVHPL